MIKGNRIFAGFVLALLVIGALSGATAFAEVGVDEGVQETEAPVEVVGTLPSEDVSEEGEALPPVEETDQAESGGRDRQPRPRPARNGGSGGRSAAAGASVQPEPEGQGSVEFDPASAAGMCPGTAMKIDNLRSNGTFGPITISDYTNTSFTWTSTEPVSAVLVKDGGGHKTNPGGSSGSASTFGQDISHVIFCLGGDVPDVDAETPEEPCDADDTTPEIDPCVPPPCDGDDTMAGTQPCVPPPCDGDDTMAGTQPCVPPPCDADETMPGTQPCVPLPCDADDTMPGRQDCTVDVAGVESKPEKSDDDAVKGAGLTADRAPDVAPMAAQAVAEGPILPLTGGHIAGLVTIAMGLVTAGGGAVLIRRP